MLLNGPDVGLDKNLIAVDLVEAEHRAPDYQGRNPQMLVPFLEDGDTGIAQSQAIIEYLDLLRNEVKHFRRSFKKWRKGLLE